MGITKEKMNINKIFKKILELNCSLLRLLIILSIELAMNKITSTNCLPTAT